MSVRGIALFILLCLLWGGAYPFIKMGLDYAPPLAFGAFRIVLSTAVLGGAVWLIARRGPRWDRTQWLVILLGFLNIGGLMIGMNVGMTVVSAGVSSVLVYTQPLMVAVLAWVLLGERLGGLRVAGVVIGFAGMVVVLSERLQGGDGAPWWGYLAILGGAFSWSLATVYFKRIQSRVDFLWTIVLQNLYGAVPLIVLSLAFERRPIQWTGQFLVICAGLALLSTGLAYLLWFYLLSRGEASSVSAYLFLVPVFGLLASALVLGEQPTARILLGGPLIMAGIYLVNRSPATRSSPPPAPSGPAAGGPDRPAPEAVYR